MIFITNIVLYITIVIVESKEMSFLAEWLILELTVMDFHRLKKTVGCIR